MRKILCSLTILALSLTAVGSFAKTIKVVPKTTSGKPIPKGFVKWQGHDPSSLAQFKAQNHLSYAMNSKLKAVALMAPKGKYVKGTIDTLPYFSSWFITGSRNSIYPYSMVGGSPSAGGTTSVNTQLIPLISVLLYNGSEVAVYDPTVANDPEGDDVSLVAQSPLFDASTTYPGPPPQTGQFDDTLMRTTFRATAAANWHTQLVPTSSGIVWIQFLEYFNGDWTDACDSMGNCIPVFNIDTISNNFAFILSVEAPANTTAPIIVTDYLTAFDPSSGGCCILGYHTVQPGIQDPSGMLVWGWGTFIAHDAYNLFGPCCSDISTFSHELSELINDPFVGFGGTPVSPWVSGGLTLAQGNLEVGDIIEDMNPIDSIYQVTLNTTGGPYTYNEQNEGTLEWFVRTPFNGGIYSWPNEHTLGQAPHVPGTCAGGPTWTYGQGSGGFYFCSSATGW